jgi:hypothetical protein
VRRHERRIRFAVGLAWLAALALGTAPADAGFIHPFKASFNGSATPAGSFTPQGVAVDGSGDVYVSDVAHDVVDKLSSSGTYLCQITGAGESSSSPSECDKSAPGPGLFASAFGEGIVEPGGALLFPDYSGHVIDRFSAAGVYAPPQLSVPGSGSALQVALDASGDIYALDLVHRVIDRYEPATLTWSTFATGTPAGHFAFPGPSGIAIDTDPSSPSFGDVYVADPALGAVDVFKADGSYASRITATPRGVLSSSLGKLAVDPSDGHLFVADTTNRMLDEFAPGGVFVSQTAVPAAPAASSPQSVAVDPASMTVYVADKANNVIDAFASIAVPNVETKPATLVEDTAATLNGHLDPATADGGGEVTQCRFEYVVASEYKPSEVNPYAAGATAPCSPGPPYTSPNDVAAHIASGLTPSTTYHYRLRAANANGAGEGEDETFTTPGPARVDSEYSQVSGVNAALKAKIDPFGHETTCQVQYVDGTDFQSSGYAQATTVACLKGPGAGFADQIVGVQVNSLKIKTTYHYRFLATNGAGSVTGADRTFLTWGVQNVHVEVIGEAGEGHPYTQAGGHPYELTTSFEPTWSENVGGIPHPESLAHQQEIPTGNPRTVISKLPPGLIGYPSATLKCSARDLFEEHCSGAAQVGVARVNLVGESGWGFGCCNVGGLGGLAGIYNMVPPRGVAAELGFNIDNHLNVYIEVGLRSGEDYGVISESPNNTIVAGISEIILHFWGVPADPRHDKERQCALPGPFGGKNPCSLNERVLKPFLRNPTSCEGPLSTSLEADSWQAPGGFSGESVGLPAITGCEKVPFSPSLAVAPTTNAVDSASGLSFDLHLPQPDEANGVGESDLKDTTIAFPVGLTVDPSSADGLAACSEAQVGFTGFAELDPGSEPGVRTAQFTPTPAQCPDASKLGTVEVDTPLLDHPLTGAIYLARQGENPFGSLLAVYIAIYDPVTGVVVKLPGEVKADPQTGQLSTTVDQSPQVPFGDFKISLFEGPRAAFTTPATCGVFTTTSVMSPWSGGAPVSPSSSFEVTSGAGEGSCPATAAQEPMAPSFSVGTFTPIAGAYSPLVVKLGREDGSQQLQSLSVTLPEGLLGKLAGVGQCPQAAIEAAQRRSGLGEGHLELEGPSCPSGSDIGGVHVGVGSGAPFYVNARAYLAGPYEGAPFSVVVIAPAVAGPFDLGTVVVRSALFIDPRTVRVTVKSDPFPTMLDGIPLEIRSISVQASRPGFTLNPTSCEKMTVTGTILSTQGVQANVSSPFRVGGCNNLPFKPSFTASTNGATSRASGASLSVNVSAGLGEANIAKVDVQLPKQLPSRLSTIQKACTDSVFGANPAACPAASRVATVMVHTPLLGAPLTGPAYFVSHGGAAFPDLVMVLQSEGVTVMLVGQTEIKNGITYSRFEAVPDAPFTSFELTAPQGPNSIFAANVPVSANHSLCGQTLSMPTMLTAQNGLVLKQNTKIQVTGCATAKKLTRAQRLARALRACRHRYGSAKLHPRRKACEHAARRRFRANGKSKRSGKKRP